MEPRFSYKSDEDEDQRASPQETAKQLHDLEQQSGFDRDFKNMTSPEQMAKDGKSGNPKSVRDDEDLAGGLYKPLAGGKIDKQRLQKALEIARKRGPLFGILSLLGVGGVIAASFLGPASMVVSIMENFTTSNDSSSTSLERRFMKVLGGVTTGDPSGLCAKSTSITCKEGRISNSALSKLADQGITPLDSAGNPVELKADGYPDKNPAKYGVDLGDGAGIQKVSADKLPGIFNDNPKLAAKVIGTGGAFNLRLKAWSGKYISKKLFNKFNLDREGGLADGKNKSSKYSDVLAKFKEKIPALGKLDNINSIVGDKVSTRLEATKKGGTAYTAAVAGCVAVKAPAYIAAGVAAVQLAQLLPVVMDVILSPGSKIKAAGVDPSTSFTSDDASSIGNLLTEKTPRASDGKMTSALDSPYLQSAMGVNKNTLPISTDYTPGYAVLTSSIVVGSIAAEKASAPACNALMSPSAMYSAAAADAASTVALSTTVVGGLVKVLGGLVISEVVQRVASQVIGSIGADVVKNLASNDLVPQAQGQALGDVIGLSAMSFFSAGGMARNLPTLKKSQVSQFVAIQQQDQKQQRDMDIASLSPFDTSSRYTFMGSIVYNMHMATLTSGSYGGGALSMLSSAIKLPFGLSDSASAATTYSDVTCGYAGAFNLSTSDPANDPAINAAGLPCTGITTQQATMSTADAISLVENEGWLDETQPIADGATIDDLVSSGYIKDGTPLSDYIKTCSDASSGDYIYNAAGCTLDPATSGLVNGNSMVAIPVFLLDFQTAQMINGEDEGNGTDAPTTATSAVADATIDQAHIYDDSSSIACAAGAPDAGINQGYVNGKEVNIRLCSIPNTVDMGPDGKSKQPIRVNSRVSGAVLQMVNALIASPVNKGKVPLRVSDSFRTMAGQKAVVAQYGLGRAAPAGYSNHQMGLAIDFQLGGPGGNTGVTKVGDPTYDWLVANAKNYGYAKLRTEAWHWQPIAAQGSLVM